MSNIRFYSTQKSINFRKKMDRVARRGSLVRAPWRAKVSQCRKIERGTLWRFSTSILSQNMKKLKKKQKFLFSEKNLTVPKKTERGTLWDFPTSGLSQNTKKIEGGPFGEKISGKKVSQCRKKLEGGTLWSPRVWYGTRENRKNLFGSVR